MSRRSQGPKVSETGYVSTTDGPASDTESYYKATPAPGQRVEWRDGPPAARASAKTPMRLSFRSREPNSGEKRSIAIPWMWIGAGAGILGLFAVMTALGGLVVWGLYPSGDADDSEQTQDDETWEGLKVKKGLR